MAALSLKQFYHRYGTGCPNSWEQCEQIWKAATEYADENCHGLKQLKSEIAALANELSDFNGARVAPYGRVTEIVEKMRQLSAVGG